MLRTEVTRTMKHLVESLVRVALILLVVCAFWWASITSLSTFVNLTVVVGGPLLVFPVSWFGRKMLDRHQRAVVWITTFVHVAVMLLLGVPTVRAVTTHRDWSGWLLPIPPEIGHVLVIFTGGTCLLTVGNLALKGFGAPFFILLSRRLAADWLYARTRNPMVLATLALGLSLGIWFRAPLFVLWVLILFSPALLTYVKLYEERELELRFGASYLEYKSKTPMLFPRMSKDGGTPHSLPTHIRRRLP